MTDMSFYPIKVEKAFRIQQRENCDLPQSQRQNKQTGERKAAFNLEELLSFTHSISQRQSIRTRACQPDAALTRSVMEFLDTNMAGCVLEGAG